MDSQIDVEAVRAQLQAMPRRDVLQLAQECGVRPSTLQKFRKGHITDTSGSRLAAIVNGLAARRKATTPPRQPDPSPVA